MSQYTESTTTSSLSGDFIQQTRVAVESAARKTRPKQSGAFTWGLHGYRSDTADILAILRQPRDRPFDDRHTVRDEARWLALYCADEEYTLQYLMRKTGLRRNALPEFFNYYSVDLKARQMMEVENGNL